MPPGTGPFGAPGGGVSRRWVTPHDLLAHHFDRPSTPRAEEWRSPQPPLGSAPTTRDPPVLRDYQEAAVHALVSCSDTGAACPRTFRSGIVEMDCGLGKTFVGGELIRLSGCPAVVVTQHKLSVQQWVRHLRDIVGLRSVQTLDTVRQRWKVWDPLPDALVVTYQSLVQVAGALEAHAAQLRAARERGDLHDAGGSIAAVEEPHPLLWLLHVAPFGLLVLDEAHLAAADHFRFACRLRAGAAVGLSGSLVREDDHLDRLTQLVGPVRYEYHGARDVVYEIVTVDLADEARALLEQTRSRSAAEHAIRALNPLKVDALCDVVRRERFAEGRVLVFCDSRQAAAALGVLLGADVMHGGTAEAERARMTERFRAARVGGSVLVATRVCDAAIDFPSGCVVVQMHSSSGSRQQEVQRCGRSSRDEMHSARVVHLVNRGTEEEAFLERRVRHMREQQERGEGTFRETRRHHRAAADAPDPECYAPLQTLSRVRLGGGGGARRGARAPRQNCQEARKRLRLR